MNSAVADVNVLVVGSATDSSSCDYSSQTPGYYKMHATPVAAFNPTNVVEEFTRILEGAELVAVNVVFEDFYGTANGYRCSNLFSWFHFPFGEESQAERWQNLRGELGTEWDYVVLLGDAHTIEYLPGFYALGVAEILNEVAKGSAMTILLMPWPAAGSSSSIDHYKEVVYRVGRSGGCPVAPAGLAWEQRREASGAEHPTQNGAYIAAATLYSRLFNQSASVSTYDFNDSLADGAYATVQANQGAVQYTGLFASPHPHSAQFNSNRNIDYSITGTSTERGHLACLKVVTEKCRVNHTKSFSHRYNTDDPGNEASGWPTDGDGSPLGPIDFNFGKFDFYNYDDYNVNPAFWKRAYIFQYQGLLTDENALAQIAYQDLSAGVKAYQHSSYVGATIPRSGWAMLHRARPNIEMNGSGNHLTKISILPNASFIYTVDSGRCPLSPEVENSTDEWAALRVGYEAGWMMSHLQARAPGFRVLPSSAGKQEINNYSSDGAEVMTVQFIFKPQAPVTVHLTSSNPNAIAITPSTLVFTPGNHDVAQSYTVSIRDGAASTEEKVSVNVTTTSDDEVFNNLSDHWVYTAKAKAVDSLPVAVSDAYRIGVNQERIQSVETGVTANDISNPACPISCAALVSNVCHGTLLLNSDGSFVYSPEADFEGKDSFSYRVSNANGNSAAAVVTLAVSDLDPSLIVWYDFEEMNGTVVPDRTAYERDATMKSSPSQTSGVAEGSFGMDLTGGSIEIPIDQEFHDLVDREITIAFWGNINPVASNSGNDVSIALKGTKTYGETTYSSLRVWFQTMMVNDQYNIFWENGIYTQGNEPSVIGRPYSYTLRVLSGKSGFTPCDLNGRWVHWAFTRSRDSGNFRIYKDGALVDQKAMAGLNEIGLIDEIDNLILGAGYKGCMDDFRIYNRELTGTEIAEILLETSMPEPQLWTGNADQNNSWGAPENWSLKRTPTIGSVLEVCTEDIITVSPDASISPLSSVTLNKGELAIAAGGHLALQSGSVLTMGGGRITRDYSERGNTRIGVGGVESRLDMSAGRIEFKNGAANDLTEIYANLSLSGGDVDIDSQARLFGALTISGRAATVDCEALKGIPGSTIRFELDDAGVSPIHVATWADIADTTISIDGSSYTGGAAVIPLIQSTNLPKPSQHVEIVGFEGRGYSVQVDQCLESDEVTLSVDMDATATTMN